MRAIIPFLLIVSCAAAQSVPRNRLTFSGGWSREVGGYSSEKLTATGLGFSYGYRVHNHIEAEAGLFTALDPTSEVCSHSGCVTSTTVTSGFRSAFVSSRRWPTTA